MPQNWGFLSLEVTWRSRVLIQVVTQRILQSQVRKRPPRLRPRRLELRLVKAASGRLDMGLPSRASRVRPVIPENASSGRRRRRLKPRSRT